MINVEIINKLHGHIEVWQLRNGWFVAYVYVGDALIHVVRNHDQHRAVVAALEHYHRDVAHLESANVGLRQ